MKVSFLVPGNISQMIVSCSCATWHWHISHRNEAEEHFEQHRREVVEQRPHEGQIANVVKLPYTTGSQYRLIVQIVARYYGTSISALFVVKRASSRLAPRDVVTYLTREVLELSYSNTSILLGNSVDTVKHSNQAVNRAKASDELFARELEALEAEVQRALDIGVVEAIDDSLISPEQRVIRAVCSHYNIGPLRLLSVSRKHDLILPRQIAMFIMRHYLSMSYPSIAEVFNKDHTTVMYAVNKVAARIRPTADDSLATIIDTIAADAGV